ncbi:MAG: uncharacterized protein A8A55_0191 [Amphiamblys sp. WSBS2006]|nr:MAG: uncharacterized protein A8A55_0191 [Amphiamblys sp. WSBS2006]
MLGRFLFAKLIYLTAVLKNIVGYKMNIFERVVYPITTRYISKAHHIYALLAFYYFWTYTAPLFVAVMWCGSCCTGTGSGTQRECKLIPERVKEMRQIILNGFPGILAAIFTATLCKVDVDTRVFFTFMAVVSRLCAIDYLILRCPRLSKYMLIVSDVACLMLFAFSLSPGYTRAVTDSWGTKIASYYVSALTSVFSAVAGYFQRAPAGGRTEL